MQQTERTRLIIWTFAALCTLNLIASLDATALSVCIPIIAADLDATSVQAYWTGTAFILASAVFQPVISALSKAFGRRLMLQLSLALFGVGTIVAATAHHAATLLVGRTLQGVGGGGMLTLTYVVMADFLSLRGRAKGISVLGAVWMLGTCAGPVMGGGFAMHVTWRWIFWICLPIVGVGLVLVQFFLWTPFQRDKAGDVVKKFDWGGSAMFIASVTCFLVAISWYNWDSTATLVPLILGLVGIVAWLFYQRYIPTSPMLPLEVFASPTAIIGFVDTLLMGIVMFSMLYFQPLYYEASKGYSPLISGAALLPTCIGTVITSTTLGLYISKTGHYNRITWLGWILMALGSGLLTLLDSETPIAAWIFITAIPGLGLGCQFVSLSMATQAPQGIEYEAIAAGLIPFFRAIGQAFGIAIGDAIYQNMLRNYLKDAESPDLRIRAEEYAKDSASIVATLSLWKGTSAEKAELVDAFNKSLHVIWWTMVGVSVLGGVMSVFMKEVNLDRMTGHTGSESSGSEMSDLETGVKSNGRRGDTAGRGEEGRALIP